MHFIARHKGPAQQWRNPHQLKKISRDDSRLNALGLRPSEKRESHRMMFSQIGHCLILRAVIFNLLDREVKIVVAAERCLLPQDYQLPPLLKRERPYKHTIHHTEDCGVRANAQRQRQDGEQGKARIAAQGARAEPRVLPDSFERTVALDIAALFFEPLDPAKTAHGCLMGIFAVHPAPYVLFGLHLEMEAELALHFTLPPFDSEQRAQTTPQSTRHNFASSLSPVNL